MSLARIDGNVVQTAIISLSIIKSISTLFGTEYASQHMPIETGWDSVLELYLYAIQLCADKIYQRYNENDGTEITGIENGDMTEYFKLAYKYGELKGLSEKHNTFLTDANTAICNTLGDISHYSFDFCLHTSKRRKPRLFLLCFPDYYPNAEVIYQLYKFLGFFKDAIPLLESELKALEKADKPKKIRIKETQKRRKTA